MITLPQSLIPFSFIISVVIGVEILKIIEQKVIGLNERVKDVFYSILAGLSIAALKYFNIIDLEWDVILPLLFSPQGFFVVIKKILGR